MTHTIEDKEIRGISTKLLVYIVVHTAVIVGVACTFYFSVIDRVDIIITQREEQNKYWELKFEQISLQNTAIQKQVDFLQQQFSDYILKQNQPK